MLTFNGTVTGILSSVGAAASTSYLKRGRGRLCCQGQSHWKKPPQKTQLHFEICVCRDRKRETYPNDPFSIMDFFFLPAAIERRAEGRGCLRASDL